MNGAPGRDLEIVALTVAQLRLILVPTHHHPNHPVVRRLTCVWPVIGQYNTNLAPATPRARIHIIPQNENQEARPINGVAQGRARLDLIAPRGKEA